MRRLCPVSSSIAVYHHHISAPARLPSESHTIYCYSSLIDPLYYPCLSEPSMTLLRLHCTILHVNHAVII